MRKSMALILIWLNTLSFSAYPQLPQPLGHGVRTTGNVYSMAFDSVNQKLYVGGIFENIGGVEVNNIGVWDGVQWQGLGSGITGAVRQIKCDNGNVYVSGSFEDAGGQVVKNIAMWDGISWHTLGPVPITSNPIYMIEIFKGELYVSAKLTINNPTMPGVAKWDGSQWSVIALTDTTNAYISQLINVNDTLWISGKFGKLNNQSTRNLAIYDGINITDRSINPQSDISLTSTANLNNTFYAISYNRELYHWSDGSWHVDTLLNSTITSLLLVYRDSLFILDYVNNGNSDTIHLWSYYNGLKQNKIADITSDVGASLAINAAAICNQKIILGGKFSGFSGKTILSMASFDGNSWQQFGGVAIRYAGYSDYAIINTMTYDTLTANVYVGGLFTFAGDSVASNVARWDGSQWHPMGDGFNGEVNKLIFYHDTLYAGGYFTASGSTIVNYFAKWDGTTWLTTGTGSTNYVHDMLVYNNKLYVGGNFTSFNGINVNALIKFNGTTWSPVATNYVFNVPIRSIAVYNNNLVVAPASVSNFAFGQWPNITYSSLAIQSGAKFIKLDDNNFDFRKVLTFNDSLYGCTDIPYSVIQYTGLSWTGVALNSAWAKFDLVTDQEILFATNTNFGTYQFSNNNFSLFQNFVQVHGFHKIDSTHLLIGGFFPEYFNGLTRIPLYNAGILELTKPLVSKTQDNDTICDHQYVFYSGNTSSFPTTYEWLFPGGIPATSNLQFPIVKYNSTGSYDVWLKETNAYGTDSVHFINNTVVVNCFVDVNENSNEVSCLVYPNPATQHINIRTVAKEIRIEVFNSLGIQVRYSSSNKQNDFTVIDCSDWMKGLYIIRISTEKGTVTKKIIVE